MTSQPNGTTPHTQGKEPKKCYGIMVHCPVCGESYCDKCFTSCPNHDDVVPTPTQECKHENPIATRCDEQCGCNLLHVYCEDCQEPLDTIQADFDTFPKQKPTTQPSEGWDEFRNDVIRLINSISFISGTKDRKWQKVLSEVIRTRQEFLNKWHSLLATARREERNMMYQKLSDWLEHDGLCAVHEHHECTCGLIARVNSLLTPKKGE